MACRLDELLDQKLRSSCLFKQPIGLLVCALVDPELSWKKGGQHINSPNGLEEKRLAQPLYESALCTVSILLAFHLQQCGLDCCAQIAASFLLT
eukprot:1139507-Pelagomonas_calceolata.AAC.3